MTENTGMGNPEEIKEKEEITETVVTEKPKTGKRNNKKTEDNAGENLIKVKIPEDPLNPGIDTVPVTINDQKIEVPVGKTTEVSPTVAAILEDAGYL